MTNLEKWQKSLTITDCWRALWYSDSWGCGKCSNHNQIDNSRCGYDENESLNSEIICALGFVEWANSEAE